MVGKMKIKNRKLKKKKKTLGIITRGVWTLTGWMDRYEDGFRWIIRLISIAWGAHWAVPAAGVGGTDGFSTVHFPTIGTFAEIPDDYD